MAAQTHTNVSKSKHHTHAESSTMPPPICLHHQHPTPSASASTSANPGVAVQYWPVLDSVIVFIVRVLMEGEAQCTGTMRKGGKLYRTSVC